LSFSRDGLCFIAKKTKILVASLSQSQGLGFQAGRALKFFFNFSVLL